MLVAGVAAATIVLGLSACGSSSSTKDGTAAGNNASRPSSGPGWAGLGATKANWEAAHPKRTSDCEAAPCYGSKLEVAGKPIIEYNLVSFTPEGRVDAFERAFPAGTSAALAKEELQRLLPGDARTVSFKVDHRSTGRCGLWVVRSATLASWLANSKVRDSDGLAGVVIFTAKSRHGTGPVRAKVRSGLSDVVYAVGTGSC
jgi:hypothetical protein